MGEGAKLEGMGDAPVLLFHRVDFPIGTVDSLA